MVENKQHKVLLAGGTGYLGGYIACVLKSENYFNRLLIRNKQKLLRKKIPYDDIVEADLSRDNIEGCCKNMDYVITTVGITSQQEGKTFWDVDYRANVKLLQEAESAGVKKFLYVSTFQGKKLRHLKILEAKEQFVEDLKNSSLNYGVLRPTGFFSDMAYFLQSAHQGKIYLIGDGTQKINPINGKDAADYCIEMLTSQKTSLNIGGPVVYSYNELAALAFKYTENPPDISYIPVTLLNSVLFLLRWFTPVSFYGTYEFLFTVLKCDMVAPKRGTCYLEDYFKKLSSSNEVGARGNDFEK